MLTASGRMDGHHGTRDLVARDRYAKYDLLLYRERVAERTIWTVDCLMRVDFSFVDDSGGWWTGAERTRFVRDWERVIRGVWSTSTLLPRTRTREVGFRPVFDVSMRERADEHWSIVVQKRSPADAAADRGATSPSFQIVLLNQRQNQLKTLAESVQFTSAHEYGHMLNLLEDEYEAGSAHRRDPDSVMHSGNLVRARHMARFRMWAETQIARVEAREAEAARRRVREFERFRRETLRGEPAARDAYRHLDERQRRRADG